VTWPRLLDALTRPVILAWNALFVFMLFLTVVPHQVGFPADAAAYPVDAPAAPVLAQIPLYAMLLLSPVVIVDFVLYVRGLLAEGASLPQLGRGFALASLLILVMVFLHVFTTIYDYAAPVGPLFRDRFWLVYLLAGLMLALPALSAPQGQVRSPAPAAPLRWASWAAAAIGITTGVALFLTAARPPKVEMLSDGLRVMTYNIQQGFDRVGNADLSGQLAAIQRIAPDILGLQESDTARVANGNVDAVRFFADRLGMYSYYGPTTTTGTFGIALLSKYPIENARTFFLYSSGEQTACIQAQIKVKDRTYNVFVTHLGNGGPMVQLQDLLSRVDSLPNVLLMGDFNFGPSSPQYALATGSLKDAWLLRWPGGKEIWQNGGDDRIDQVFVSPDTDVLEADYVPDPASDHPYLYVVIGR
ncbi:MAG: endonuclease/exonuclease/phosphatase family protein, partial [Anaerolineae bacterium]